MIRFALFGAGFIGQVHGANIAAHPRASLQYVYDVSDAAAQQLAERTGARVARSAVESLQKHQPVQVTYWQPD